MASFFIFLFNVCEVQRACSLEGCLGFLGFRLCYSEIIGMQNFFDVLHVKSLCTTSEPVFVLNLLEFL